VTDTAAPSSTHRSRGAARRGGETRAGRGFSLIELMVAIVILGLGLVMVATMFPIAWGRARDLSEFTVQQSITPAAENLATRLLGVAGGDLCSDVNDPKCKNIRASFAGDLIYDKYNILAVINSMNPNGGAPYYDPPPWPSDTLVHALNAENIRIASSLQGRALIAEDPWRLERALDLWDECPNLDPASDLIANSYMNPQIYIHQRFHPPLSPRKHVDRPPVVLPPRDAPDDPAGVFTDTPAEKDDKWDDAVSSRRFAWAMFHRLRERVAGTEAAADESRTFDFYYVTLRRPQPTHRYARQNSEPGTLPPSARDNWFFPLALPEAMQADEDVAFPIAWRVQVEFPEAIVPAYTQTAPNSPPIDTATNIPTEIRIPPENFLGGNNAKRMLVTMFPRGTQFIDEITGKVLRVVQVREAIDGLSATLTLDREIFREEIDIAPTLLPDDDPVCVGALPGQCILQYLPCYDKDINGCTYTPNNPAVALDPPDRIRTVWVFPPPAEDRENEDEYPVFSGNPPVVQIDVHTTTVTPNG